MGREMGGKYVYLWLIHVEVWQKTTKFCKAISLQLKNKRNAYLILCLIDHVKKHLGKWLLRNWDRRACSVSLIPWLCLTHGENMGMSIEFCSGLILGRRELGKYLSPLVTTPHEIVSIMHGQEQNSNQLNFLRLTSLFDSLIYFGLSCYSFLRYHGKTRRNWVEREVGGGIGMGNTCKSMADSCQCMTKPTTTL